MAVGDSASFDCVLIDDDEVIRATWALAAKVAGRRLLSVARSADFWTHAPHLDRRIPIYVDYSLIRGPDGGNVVERLVAAGFTQIHVETGYDATEVDPRTRSMIKDVIGKSPPWMKNEVHRP